MPLIDEIKDFGARRARELTELAKAELTIEEVELTVAGQKVSFRVNVETRAAWQLYVELNTRITTQQLAEHQGSLREALSSLYQLFGITRQILKEAGPRVGVGDKSLGFYAMEILNQVLRPLLSTWHPLLADWESEREPGMPKIKHEHAWEQAPALRSEIEQSRAILLEYSDALAMIAGVAPDQPGDDNVGQT